MYLGLRKVIFGQSIVQLSLSFFFFFFLYSPTTLLSFKSAMIQFYLLTYKNIDKT